VVSKHYVPQASLNVTANAALVIGTSRQDGNTWGLLRAANERLGLPVFNLADLSISYFDYDSRNLNDDFIPTIEKLIGFETIGLISPVYWLPLAFGYYDVCCSHEIALVLSHVLRRT
jgi:hypothetical protein